MHIHTHSYRCKHNTYVSQESFFSGVYTGVLILKERSFISTVHVGNKTSPFALHSVNILKEIQVYCHELKSGKSGNFGLFPIRDLNP